MTHFFVSTLQIARKITAVKWNVSSLCFCDLAGSERSKKIGNDSKRLDESKTINKSLLQAMLRSYYGLSVFLPIFYLRVRHTIEMQCVFVNITWNIINFNFLGIPMSNRFKYALV